jgi:diguanylate cyclase (GGDEF)-like protein/PAS domain S-box-containing protein
MTIWSFCYGLEISFSELSLIKTMNRFGYIGIVTAPVFWFIFALRYAKKEIQLDSYKIRLLFIVPALSLIMVTTNDLHFLFYSTIDLGISGFYHFQKTTHGVFWWVHVCYSYLALCGGLILFIKNFFQVPRIQRWHVVMFITGAFIPLFINVCYIAGFKPYGFLDLTPFAFPFSGIMFLAAISLTNLFDVSPLTLDKVFDNIPDIVAVLDSENKIVKINPSGKALFGDDVFQKNINKFKTTKYSEKEFKRGKKAYFSRKKPIFDATGKYLGSLIMISDITKQKQLEKILRESRENYREIINGMNDTAWIIGFNGKFVEANKSAVSTLGYSRKELLLIGPEDIDSNLSHEQITNLIKQMPHDKIQTFETQHKTKTGRIIPVEISSSLVNYQGEKAILSIARDITQRKQAEEALRKSQEEFLSLFQSNPEATVYADEKGYVIYVNSRFTELFGYTLEEFKGKSIDSGLIQTPELTEEAKVLTKNGLSKDYVGMETVRKKKDGTLVPVYISGSPVIVDNQVKGTIAVYYDISERKKAEEQLKKLSRTDTLTGCYNRRYGLDLIKRQIKLANRNELPLLLAFFDIDNFKKINDDYGHLEGDEVLKRVASLFKAKLREVDIICRMGGDEFLLAFPDSSLKETTLITSRLEKIISQYNKKSNKDYQLSLSIGFSEYLPDKPKELDELISIADQEMYKDKHSKKMKM